MLFHRISDRVYYLPPDNEEYRPVSVVVLGKDKTLVIDGGATREQAERIQQGLEELDRKADYLLLTHWHWDHSFGLAYWPKETISISHEKTLGHLDYQSRLDWNDDALYGRMEREEEPEFFARLIKEAYPDLSEIDIALPQKYYSSQEVLDLGGLEVELHYLPSDHSDDNTVVYVPQEKFLFLGDVLSENILGESWFYTYHRLASVVDRLRQWDDIITVCESHGSPIDRISFHDLLNQLEKVNEGVRNSMDKGEPESAHAYVEKEMGRPLTEEEEDLIRSFLYGYYL